MISSDTPSSRRSLIIVGNGMVGHHCVEQLLALGATDHYRIHVFGAEAVPAYDRVHLSEYFSGRDADSLALGDAELYRQAGIERHLGTPVTAIDRVRREVITAGGRFAYEELILATGSVPFVPEIEGAKGNARLVYRNLEDLDRIRAAAQGARRGVVVGGGLLGLEAANALRLLGLESHVVELAPRLMPVQLDEPGGAALKARIEALGLGVHTGKATRAIVAGEAFRYRMIFAGDDAGHLETDLIVFSAGIRPEDRLARDCGLVIGLRGGIAIDDNCRSSDPHIHVIGECAAWNGSTFGLVAPGYRMARHVAARLCGRESTAFTGADMSTKLKLLGVDVGSIGDAHGLTPGARSYRYIDEATSSYRRLIVSADGSRAVGAVLVGDNGSYDLLHQYVLNGAKLPADPASLILPRAEGAPAPGADALPDTATLCSCHNVSKGDVCAAVGAGCSELADLKSRTRAATGCGGCASLLKRVFDGELAARGVAVDRSLCEHFPHTRQELYHLVRVGRIETFDELLARHGKGHLGCDLCKPVVASILASCWNRPIQVPALVPLQDTNVTFMANMQ
jgi:nitrite reductase (NADH) large subunit